MHYLLLFMHFACLAAR